MSTRKYGCYCEFARGNVLIRVGNNDYSVIVIVGMTSSKSLVLYDIVNFEPTQIKIKKTSQSAMLKKAGSERNVKSSTNIIPNATKNVNEKFDAREKKENVATAKAYFGTTYNIKEAGYLLTDGKLLDFSGKHEGGRGGYRTVDHRDIGDAFDEDYRGESYTDAMINFMNEGNIRLSPESGGINLIHKPNKAQMDVLSRYISNYRGEVMLDIDDERGNTISSTEYPKFIHSSVVLNDIIDYFDNGKEITKFDERGDYNRKSEERELLNDFYPALEKSEWAMYYRYITDNGYLCSDIGDYMSIVLGNKLVISQKRMTSKNSNDFQVIEIFKVNNSNYTDVYAIQSIVDEILESGEAYDNGAIEERIIKIIEINGGKQIFSKFDRNNARFTDDNTISGVQRSFAGGNRNSKTESNRTRISHSNESVVRNEKIDKKLDERNNIYDLLGENKRLKQENERLAKKIVDLKELVKLQRKITHGKVLDRNSVSKMANILIKETGSKINQET